MKVKFIRNGAGFGFGYFAGDKADIEPKQAAVLIKNKVISIDEDHSNGCELPVDIPHRDILELAGIVSMDDLQKYEDNLIEINGIGEAKATDIKDYLVKVI